MNANIKLLDVKLKNLFKKYLNSGPDFHPDRVIYRSMRELYDDNNARAYRKSTFLAAIAQSPSQPSNVILQLIDEFLERLTIEEISEYFNYNDKTGKNLISCCQDINLMKIIIKHINRTNTQCLPQHKFRPLLKIFHPTGPPTTLEMVQLLLDNGADVNVAGYMELTPLMNCIIHWRHGDYESIAELLIRRGANISAKSCHGQTPYQYALMFSLPLSERLSRMLQGEIVLSYTKPATKLR